jgi:hypothetical protein
MVRKSMSVRLLFLGAVALALMVTMVAAAGAKPAKKPPFKPQTGDYTGSQKFASGESGTMEALVEKVDGKYYVELTGDTPSACSDGSYLTVPLRGQAYLKEETFKFTGTIPNPMAGLGSKEIQVKVSGHFTSKTTLVATASAETAVEAGNTASKACSTGSVSVSLKKAS